MNPIRCATVALLAGAGLLGGGCGSSTSSPTAHTGAGPGRATNAHGATSSRARPTVVARLVPPAGAPLRTVNVPVLTWHRVHSLRPGANAIETDLTVDPKAFFAEVAALRSSGHHAISLTQLFDALWKGARLPSKPVLITVDDGYADDTRAILPILRRFEFTATFFVITGRTHEPGFMTAAQIRELDLAGMDVEDHTRHHVDLTAETPAALRAEVAGSRSDLERILGHPVYALAYPFGANNPAVVAATRAAGYTMAFTTAGGTRLSTDSPLTMPRLHVGRSATPQSVVALAGK